MKGEKAVLAKGIILWASLLIIGLSFAYGNATEVVLKATPEQFDTGTVPEGKTIEVTASIQNVGNSPVEITSVKTS